MTKNAFLKFNMYKFMIYLKVGTDKAGCETESSLVFDWVVSIAH